MGTLMQLSVDIGVRLRWIVMAIVAVGGIVALHRIGPRTNREFWLPVGHLFFLFFVLIALLFCATESDAFYYPQKRLEPVTKKLLLAGATGILVQLAIWLNRVAHGKITQYRVLSIYFDAGTGFLTGMLGAIVYGSSSTSLASLPDEKAVFGGAAGGALGLSLIDVVRHVLMPGAASIVDPQTPPAERPEAVTCQYAGLAYSAGATLEMPGDERFRVVKLCDPQTGQWVDTAPAKKREIERV
jgi:hypothetical protein